MKNVCARPIADSVLLEWWVGEVEARDGRDLDEHLLACRWCSERAEELSRLADGVAGLVRSGKLQAVVTAEVVERMRREGRRVREYRVSAGGGVQCSLAPDDDFLVARLEASVDPGTRVDLLSRVDGGPEHRVSDIPFVQGGSEIWVTEPVDEIAARPAHVQRLRLVAVTSEGDRLIGEYTFNHTPWPA
ncbi:MAG: hypothetical protein K1Y01_02085 [Vicinamibacteria bacterium]|nr:hypothetical protein [Vicinamibacteria bacterium]